MSERRLCKAEAGASGGRHTFNRHLSGLRGWGVGWGGGFFSRFAPSGLLDLLANARHNHKYYFALGSVTTTSRRVLILGVRTFGRSTPRGCLPQCLPKGGVFGLDGLTPAARARSRSLPPLPVSRLVQRHRQADPRIGKFLEISHVIVQLSNVIVGQKGSPKTSFLLFSPDSCTSSTRIHSSPILPF